MATRRRTTQALLGVVLVAVAADLWAAGPPPACSPTGKVGSVSPTEGERVSGTITVGSAGSEGVTAGTCSKLYEFLREGWSTLDSDDSINCYAWSTNVRGCNSSGAWSATVQWASYPNGGHHSHGGLSRRQYILPPPDPHPWIFMSGKQAGYTVDN